MREQFCSLDGTRDDLNEDFQKEIFSICHGVGYHSTSRKRQYGPPSLTQILHYRYEWMLPVINEELDPGFATLSVKLLKFVEFKTVCWKFNSGW